MYFQQFLNQLHGCATYLIASSDTHEAALVDPGVVTDEYEEILRRRGLRLRYIVDTHIHADHVSGGRQLAERYGAELCLHESARVAYPFHALRDGDELALGQVHLRVWHTPGHRPELISILVINTERSPEPSMVLTADALLVGDVGRPDFGGGDAEAQYQSVARLLELPDWVAVFPGHFEGPCGKGMCGRPNSTIGFEKLYNPIARLQHEAFLSAVTSEIPARPLNMAAIEATNRGNQEQAWAMLTEDTAIPEAGPEEARALLPEALLLDVREQDEFTDGHAPGARWIPQSELASRLDELPRERPIITVCRSGNRSLRSAQFLAQMGYTNVSNLTGGMTAWQEAGLPIESGVPVS